MTWPGEELIIRLWGTLVEKGIGSLLTPWQIKREGRAHIEVRRTETLAIAQTENDAEDIRTGRKRIEDFLPGLKFSIAEQALADHKGPIEPTISLPAVAKASARQMLEDSVRRQVNVAKAIVQAEQRLRGDSQDPPKEKINDDWLYRWRDYASDVSAEEMQQLWGNLLAGELKAPGSYSFRCLDSLRNLSQSEAKKIEKISPFVLENMLWRNEDNLFKSEGITLSTLLEMQELGIISGVESLGIKMTWSTNQPDKFSQALRSNGKVLIVKHDDPKKIIKIKCLHVDINR